MDQTKGFTIVELLVVIVILAILSTLAFVTYNGSVIKARDSARKTDVYEIATALEVNKTEQGYIALQIGQFSSFQWKDPSGNVYCLATSHIADPVVGGAWGDSCPSGFSAVSPGAPISNFSSWKVCTFLEQEHNSFCRISRQ